MSALDFATDASQVRAVMSQKSLAEVIGLGDRSDLWDINQDVS